MDISIVIVNWNTRDLLLNCLASVYETVTEISFEVWLVDNASTDGSEEAAKRAFPEVQIIKNKENLGFAAANNVAFQQMNGRYALLLNTDTALKGDAVRKIYDFMENHSEIGMACGQLLNEDDSKQNSIANFPSLLSLFCNETVLRIFVPKRFPSKRREYQTPIEIESCVGACVMVRKEAMDDVGLFDEAYFFFFEETDWAYRIKKAGWKIFFVPEAHIYHAQGKTVGGSVKARIMYYRSRYVFFRKWRPRSFYLICCVIFVRLLINTLMAFLGVLLTAGFHNQTKKKFIIYIQLIIWHLKGCP
jgi:GT2 family glycosyltransferase